jgi:hypothetical protein
MQIWTDFVRYNRVLFVITGKIYRKIGLNQPKYFFFVRYNRVFVITEFVITEFDCIFTIFSIVFFYPKSNTIKKNQEL